MQDWTRRTLALLPAIFILSVGSALASGGMDSGGGDVFPSEADSAWFLGNKTIRYCMVGGAEEMGVAQTTVRSLIDEAFAKWKSYIEYKGVLKGYSEPEMFFALDAHAMEVCDGTEDLKFYLGVENSEVLAAKAVFNHPIAFAHRTQYDSAKGWGRGFIWISAHKSGDLPDWQRAPHTLFGMILHELGHVLGNSHVQDTIMDEHFVDELLVATWAGAGESSNNMRRIDWGAELAENRHAHPMVGRISADPENKDVSASFKRIVGRDPSGDVKVTLRHDNHYPNSEVELVFSDEIGAHSVVVKFDLEGVENSFAVIRVPHPIFKRACVQSVCTGGASYQRLHAGYRVGSLTAADGAVLPAFLEFNLGKENRKVDAPVQVKYWDAGKKRDLFAQTELQ